ncbi:GtrA family protein [Geodermatophilus sp. YIM 151500]|uniref:GtrA family protein n=1 Tax=Geodermatophilus sp. YIM 151500 TaxID=2984531 RepID=UPI0021E385C3|nr:GtrA family protein [Geodermatophilus sp. YIM 151500]MCV2487731.1 GtrA family protein [Geodermatophilus sp. YIM 151500]
MSHTAWSPGVHRDDPTVLGDRAANAARRLAQWAGGNGGVAQLARFLTAGGVANLAYALLFLALAPLGTQPANLAGALASSALANELHRRLTFRAADRVDWWSAQWAGGGLALTGWAASSLGLAALAASGATTGATTEVVLVLAVTASIGLARFVALRWVFRPRAVRTA